MDQYPSLFALASLMKEQQTSNIFYPQRTSISYLTILSPNSTDVKLQFSPIRFSVAVLCRRSAYIMGPTLGTGLTLTIDQVELLW